MVRSPICLHPGYHDDLYAFTGVLNSISNTKRSGSGNRHFLSSPCSACLTPSRICAQAALGARLTVDGPMPSLTATAVMLGLVSLMSVQSCQSPETNTTGTPTVAAA